MRERSRPSSVPVSPADARGGKVRGRLRPIRRRPAGERMASARRAAAEIWGVYWWLIRDAVREFPRRFMLMVGLGLAGAILQWASALALLVYVNSRASSGESGFSLPIAGHLDPSVGGSDATLIGWGTIALGLVALAALTSYAAQAIGYDFAQRYAKVAGGRVLAAVDADPAVLAAAASDQAELEPTQLLRSALQQTRMVLRALLLLTRSLDSVSRLLVAGALIVLIHPLLTLVLVALGLVFLIPLYGVNRDAARASIAYEAANREAARYTSSFAQRVLHSDRSELHAQRLAEEYTQSAVLDRRFGALSGIVLTHYRSRYIVTVFAGVAAVAIVFGFALSGTDDVGGWTTALIYLAALVVGVASLNPISVTVTGASRFLPQIRRYTALIQASREKRASEPEVGGPPVVPTEIHVGSASLAGSRASLELEEGQPVFVHYPVSLDRITLVEFLERLFGLDEEEAVMARRGVRLCGEVPGIANAYAEHALEAMASDAPLVVFGWRPFSQQDNGIRERLLEDAGRARVLFVSDRMPSVQPKEVGATVIVDEDGVRGIADGDLHRAWFKEGRVQRQSSGNADVDDLDEDLDVI